MEASRKKKPAALEGELTPSRRRAGFEVVGEEGRGGQVEVLGPAAELVEAFELTLSASPQTQRTYMQSLRAFLAWLPPAAGLEGLSMKSISDYQRHMGTRREDGGGGLSLATQRKNRAAINSLLRWAASQDLISGEQVRLVRSVGLPKVTHERKRPEWLDEREMRRLFNAALAAAAETRGGDPAEVRTGPRRIAGVRDLAMVHVLLYCSLRCEELLSLDVADYERPRKDSALREIHVRSGKGGRERRVRLRPDSARALTAWMKWRTDHLGEPAGDEPLFCTLVDGRRAAGSRLERWSVVDVVEQLFAAADLDGERAHPHVLRHTGATFWLSQPGWDLVALQRHLGHASPQTTAIYVHHSEDDLDRLYTVGEREPALVRDARRAG